MTKKKYQDISYQVSTFEGIPVMETITAQEQKDFVENCYGTVNDLIEMNQLAYRDWQADC